MNKSFMFFFQSIVFLDSEGTPTQELAAIEVDLNSKAIVDVFHDFAYTAEEDDFARSHIHGLNFDYIKKHESLLCCEIALIHEFKKWMMDKPNTTIYCNGAAKERRILNNKIVDFKLLPWVERTFCMSHRIANRFKELSIPVLGQHCNPLAHACFVSSMSHRNPLIAEAKARHGYHCALYDVIELYFELILPH